MYAVAGSTARDVERYSEYQKEKELLLPCGSSFVIKGADVNPDDAELLDVSLKQTGATLLEDLKEDTALEVHQHKELAQLAESLDAEGVAVGLNRRVIPRPEWNRVIVNEGDKIEIIAPFAGG